MPECERGEGKKMQTVRTEHTKYPKKQVSEGSAIGFGINNKVIWWAPGGGGRGSRKGADERHG